MSFVRRCLVLSFTCLPLAHAEDTRPNILLIVADDLGYTDLGSYGSEIPTRHWMRSRMRVCA